MSTKRTLIRVDISIDQQWAIGAAPDLHYRPSGRAARGQDQITRQPVQRDPFGRLLLPATSLVGSLKDCLGEEPGKLWLGNGDKDATEPSALRCLAAIIINAPQIPGTVTTTAIDPSRRAAKEHALRTEEMVDPGKVIWWLEWDHENGQLNLGDLIDKLAAWQPVVGRRRSANRGRAHVTDVYHRTFDLTDDDDLTWWLAERPTFDWEADSDLRKTSWTWRRGLSAADDGELLLSCQFVVQDALHIGGAGIRVDGDDREIRCTRDVLPGSSWRGVFRHRVAHIVRVTTGDEGQAEQTVTRLFGCGRAKGASQDAGQRGQLRFADSPVQGGTRTRTHVAIDRISGGAAQLSGEDPIDDKGLLFTLDHYGPGARLALRVFNDSGDAVSEVDRSLLEHVLNDIQEGVIGVGGMTSRGYGTLSLEGAAQWEGDRS